MLSEEGGIVHFLNIIDQYQPAQHTNKCEDTNESKEAVHLNINPFPFCCITMGECNTIVSAYTMNSL